LSYSARRIQALLSRSASLAGGASTPFSFHTLTGPTAYSVPTDFVLVIYNILIAQTANTQLFVRIITPDTTFFFPVVTIPLIVPPVVVKSGHTVSIDLFNSGAGVAGGASTFAVHGVLVPSVDYETQGPASVVPYFSPLA